MLLNTRVRETLRSLHLLRRSKYVHRGSQRNFNITGTDIKVSCSRPTCTDIKQNISCGVCPANLCYPQVSTIYSDKARPEFIRFAHLNVRLLNKKTDLLYYIILNKKLDVFCISETWHQQNDFLNLNLCTPPGFTYLDKPRAIGKGGGLAVVYSTKVSVTEIVVPSVLSFESIVFKVSGVSPVLILFIIGHRNLTLCSLMNSQSYLHL